MSTTRPFLTSECTDLYLSEHVDMTMFCHHRNRVVPVLRRPDDRDIRDSHF